MATLLNPGARGSGGQPLNLAMAGLAAVAFAFFIYAMPADLFSGLVERSGLPGLVAAAEPPLGLKARGAAIAAIFILTFALVLLLMRAIDRLDTRPAVRPANSPANRTTPAQAEAPRLRRADSHPDAPARRPLLAGRDLGDFMEAEDDAEHDSGHFPPIEATFAELEVSPLPNFLDDEAEEPEAIEQGPVAFEPPAEDGKLEALVSQLPGESGGHDSIGSLMLRLESGLSKRELDADADDDHADHDHSDDDHEEAAGDVGHGLPQWLDLSEHFENGLTAPPASAEFSNEADSPEPIDFCALRSGARDFADPGEFETDEREAIDFAALRLSDRPIAEFGEIDEGASLGQREEPEDESDVETRSLNYASLRTRKPLDLNQPLPPTAELTGEQVETSAEPQAGHRLRGTINDLRRIAGRG